MDKNINLDINTYSVKELENLFKIAQPYTELEINNKKKVLENNILRSNINQSKKEELFIFLDNINTTLTNNLLQISETKLNIVNQVDGNHFIMKNKNDDYKSTLESNKQINKSIMKKTYTIDSIFRQNYDSIDNKSHDYYIELPETITNAITMSVSSVEIPLSYHNVSEELNNNIFSVSVGDTPLDVVDFSADVALTPGLYESIFTSTSQIKAQNIETEINTRLSKVNIVDISANLKFKVSLKSGFGCFVYDNSKASVYRLDQGKSIKIDFNVDNNQIRNFCSENLLYQKLGWQLGFRGSSILLDKSEKTNAVFELATGKGSVVSPGICHISYPRYLYISIDDFQTSSRNHFAIASESTIAPNIIGRINILSLLEEKTAFKQAATAGDHLFLQKHIREYFGATDIRRLRIRLLDEYGRPFPINNMDWSFLATWECFYN